MPSLVGGGFCVDKTIHDEREESAADHEQDCGGYSAVEIHIGAFEGTGLKSSNDIGVIALLKDLGFLSSEGVPTKRYHDYRDTSRSRAVMAQALREAYEELFHINARPSKADQKAIIGRFKTAHNTSDDVAERQARTFLTLLQLADLDASESKSPKTEEGEESQAAEETNNGRVRNEESPDKFLTKLGGLRYTIEVHLPPSKDIEVFNAIFKSLKEHLLGD